MPADIETARALADSLTESQIRDYRLNALKVKMESGTVTRSYEGSSFTIDRSNCEQILADCNEALAILAATAAEEERELTMEPCGRGVDFRHRITG